MDVRMIFSTRDSLVLKSINELGERLVLNCSTESFPTAITYWQRNDGAQSTMLISKSSSDYRLESAR